MLLGALIEHHSSSPFTPMPESLEKCMSGNAIHAVLPEIRHACFTTACRSEPSCQAPCKHLKPRGTVTTDGTEAVPKRPLGKSI